jgi:acyl carrier protein
MDASTVRLIGRREEALRRIRRLLIERLNVRREPDEIDPDTPLFGSGLGLDSIDSVELLVSLQSEFALRLPNDIRGRASMRTVNGLVDLVLAREEGNHGAA